MSDHSSNIPLKPVREINGTPGPSDRKPEKPSDQDRQESGSMDGEDDMAMIRSFYEASPAPVGSVNPRSTEQAHQVETPAHAAGSATGEAQASDQTSLWNLARPRNNEQVEEQNDRSASFNRSSEIPSAQDGTGQTGTSTGDGWNLLRSPDLQNHSSAPSNGSSPRPSTEDTSEQTTTPEVDGLGFLDRFNAQMSLSPASVTGVPTAPSAQAESNTNSNGDSTHPALQNGEGSTSQSGGMSFIHPLSRDLLERLGSGQSTLDGNGDPRQTP